MNSPSKSEQFVRGLMATGGPPRDVPDSAARRRPWIGALIVLGVIGVSAVVVVRLGFFTATKPIPSTRPPAIRDFITVTRKADEANPANYHTIDDLTGEDVLTRCYENYGRLNSFKCTFTIDSTAKTSTKTWTSRVEGEIQYAAPDHLAIEWNDPAAPDVSTIRFDGKNMLDVNGRVQPANVNYLKPTLLASNGTSSGATVWLPGILLRSQFDGEPFFLPHGELLPAFATKAELRGKQIINGRECYGVYCERKIATWKFWIDCQTFHIVAIDEFASPQQMGVQRTYRGGGFSGDIQETFDRHTFLNIEVDVAIPESEFQMPK